ncbi:MAG TPA: sugar ABC transporter permease [Candidatus Hydrogenedentes bacterium]|nr:sugar ABC transporter permease [Candidatus Hydrogenedentota bacterium]
MKHSQDRVGYLFISPWLIGFVLFTVGPFLISIYLSFTRYDIVSPPELIGPANYQKLLFDDPLFWKSLWITLKYAMVAVPVGIVFGVGLALLLNLDLRGISVYRTVFYVPAIVPVVATSVVFVWILNPQIGLLNGLLRNVGIIGPAWLQDTRWAFWSLVFMSLWAVGGSMIIYLAGLKDVPVTLYEAAIIDGASAWQRTRHVTLPMITPVIFFNLIMGVIGSFQYFTQAYIMTLGGPEDSTHFYALYLFNRAWRYLDMGYASAMAWILFVIVMMLTIVIFRSHHRWVHYGG